MGCDIHMHVEYRKHNNNWECGDYFALQSGSTLESPKYRFVELYGNRSYVLFSILADVRNGVGLDYISLPKGLPKDVTDFVREAYEWWDMDAHSCSYLSLKEMIDFRETHAGEDYYMLDVIIERLRQRADELNLIYDFEWSGRNHDKAYAQSSKIRIVFWFDN